MSLSYKELLETLKDLEESSGSFFGAKTVVVTANGCPVDFLGYISGVTYDNKGNLEIVIDDL